MNGYIRVKVAAPILRHGDVSYNQSVIADEIVAAFGEGVGLVVFPALSLSGNCGDFLSHPQLPLSCEQAVIALAKLTKERDITAVVGTPVLVNGVVHSAAVVLNEGKVLCVISDTAKESPIEICFAHSPTLFGRDIVINDMDFGFSVIVGNPKFSELERHANASGLIVNIFAETRTTNTLKQALRRAKSLKSSLVLAGDCNTGRFGVNSGVRLISEKGEIKCAFEGSDQSPAIFDLDIDLANETVAPFYFVGTRLHRTQKTLRCFERLPFVPKDGGEFNRVLDILSDGIYFRLRHMATDRVVFGLSGGVDSSYVAIACSHMCKKYGIPTKNVHAVLLPSVHSSTSTRKKAQDLAEYFGFSIKKINIAKVSGEVLRLIEHEGGEDVVFENNQARLRTLILLNLGNMLNALMLGTGDMSEIALGFSTYGGDQFAGLNVNAGLTKTFLRAAILDFGKNNHPKAIENLLKGIVEQPVSPELLQNQHTEDILGSYEVNDFMLYHAVFRKLPPKKVLNMAAHTFKEVPIASLLEQLKRLLKRLCAFAFKKNATCDHIQVFEFDLNCMEIPSDCVAEWAMPL